MPRSYPLPVEVDQTLVEFGERLALRRRMVGLTQADLAEQVGIGLSTLTAIERGDAGTSIGAVARVLWGLNVLSDLDTIVTFETSDPLLIERIDDVPKRVRRRKTK